VQLPAHKQLKCDQQSGIFPDAEAPALSALGAAGFFRPAVAEAAAGRGQLRHAAAHTQNHPWAGSSSLGPGDKVPAAGTLGAWHRRQAAARRLPEGRLGRGTWGFAFAHSRQTHGFLSYAASRKKELAAELPRCFLGWLKDGLGYSSLPYSACCFEAFLFPRTIIHLELKV